MAKNQINYVFDFDSTLTSVEGLDVLAEITLANNPKKDEILQEIVDITNLGIDGDISFTDSLEKRIKVIGATKADLELLVERLKTFISDSVKRNKSFFIENSEHIYIMSAGFKEFIIPVVAEYNIPAERIYANTFEFDKNGKINGFDRTNPLSVTDGKIECLRKMNLQGEVQMIGDGYSDYVTRKAGVADKFFAYTENVTRAKTIKNADYIVPNLDEFLYINDLAREISYPKNRIKILLLENIHTDAYEKFTKDGFTVETIGRGLSEDELIEKLQIIMLMRSVFQRSTEIHNGDWQKTAAGSREVRGKKLGIVGYGNIGKQLSVIAEGVGMDVYYYDIEDKLALGNATKLETLEELLSISDVISLHVDDNSQNKNYIGEKEIALMKDGVHFVNLSRGFVVDIPALVGAIKSGKIAGAAVDVYPEEPRKNGEFVSELQGLPNVILTPHVGGSTQEAQKDIADFVPNKIMGYINAGTTVIHQNVPGIMAKINKVLAEYELNISGQYLSTDPKVGYVIIDLDEGYDKEVLQKLKDIEGTIRFRVLY